MLLTEILTAPSIRGTSAYRATPVAEATGTSGGRESWSRFHSSYHGKQNIDTSGKRDPEFGIPWPSFASRDLFGLDIHLRSRIGSRTRSSEPQIRPKSAHQISAIPDIALFRSHNQAARLLPLPVVLGILPSQRRFVLTHWTNCSLTHRAHLQNCPLSHQHPSHRHGTEFLTILALSASSLPSMQVKVLALLNLNWL